MNYQEHNFYKLINVWKKNQNQVIIMYIELPITQCLKMFIILFKTFIFNFFKIPFRNVYTVVNTGFTLGLHY